jgi:hypothetical protein
MSKAVKPCSSCPAASAAAAEKASTPMGNKIKFVLEDTLPTGSDSLIKVKNFKKFLGYDVKTLNITGELQTFTHKNGFTHIKMVVTYQDKSTNKVNYLELDFLDNTKKEENKNTVGVDGGNRGCNPTYCYVNNNDFCDCENGGVVTTATDTVVKSSKDLGTGTGTPATLKIYPDAIGTAIGTVSLTVW